ncbi:MAG TPA: ABC transporter ATP-binding protein/permease [Steroidobacteraceae bacterium]|jgi:putative ATP-binding cassette transporter|nr:ABC transporter ATP-binding protein/permease [Steroidobacteraceae bacterium]
MNKVSPAAVPNPTEAEELANSRLLPQLETMVRALWAAPVRDTLFVLSGSLFIVIAATAYGQIRLNSWNQPFYDALSHRDFAQFLDQLGIFGLIAGTLLVLNVGQRWLGETLKLKLREGLAHDLIQNWLVPGRAFRLTNAGAVGVNPDQRMHEDARHLTELSADLGIGLLQSSILLASFVKVLWDLSNNFAFHFDGRQIVIPGYMVWAAIVYSGSASLLSYWVGRSLVDRNAERYAREADIRFSLVRVNEHIDAIALSEGEPDEARRIETDLTAVLKATARLVTGLTNLTWITAGYGWFTLVAPILVAAPLYFAGNLTFGGLMLASGAFIQVQSSLRWFVDNFSTLADWRATLLRVAAFRRAVIDTDVMHDVENRISYAAGKAGEFDITDLKISSPSGCTLLQENKVQIMRGERVLIVGESGAGKTLLFRALAGLWPWGSGTVTRPAGEEIVYIPRTPYLPPGTLREVLAYPKLISTFETDACAAALTRVGLGRLTPLLDSVQRWDRDLNEDEQHALGLARIIVHRAAWVLIDEVLDSVDDRSLDLVVDIFTKDLAQSGIIHIGRTDAHHLFSRVLHLIKDPTAKKLTVPAAAPTAPLLSASQA